MVLVGRVGIVLFAVIVALLISLYKHGRGADKLATISVEGRELVVRVGGVVRVTGFIGTLRVPTRAITEVRIDSKAKTSLRGRRFGIYLPRGLMAGRWRQDGRYQYVAATPSRPALVVELADRRLDWSSLIVRTADLERDLAKLAKRIR